MATISFGSNSQTPETEDPFAKLARERRALTLKVSKDLRRLDGILEPVRAQARAAHARKQQPSTTVSITPAKRAVVTRTAAKQAPAQPAAPEVAAVVVLGTVPPTAVVVTKEALEQVAAATAPTVPATLPAAKAAVAGLSPAPGK